MIGLFIFSISSWFSLGRFYTFLRIFPFLPGCPFHWHRVACKLSLMMLCISAVSIVTSPFSFLILFIYLINLFILFLSFWLLWVFIAAHGFSLVTPSGGYSSLWCAGFSLQWLLLMRSMASRHSGFHSCGLWALEHRLSSCGTRA